MFTDLLIHRVEVYRRSGARDRFNQQPDANPGKIVGAPVATYACRVRLISGGMTMQERNVDVFEKYYTLYTGLDADIREDDAVRVLNRDGRVLVERAKVKDSEAKSAFAEHHQEFTLWEQSGPKQ